MSVKFDPILNKLRAKDNIPQLDSDPSSPQAEDVWVKATLSGATGGGKIRAFMGLGFPYMAVGSGGSNSYQLSYRTKEGTTKRITLS